MNVELHQLDLRYEKLRTHKPEAERKLVGSLAEIGQQVPVVVVHGEGPERFVLVDGYKRVRALRRLGQDLVGATCWDLSEAEALVLDRLMRTGEGATALEQGWLLHELTVRFELSREGLPAVRERVLTAPLLFLKARHAVAAVPEDEGRALMDDLDMLAAVARRARRRLRQGVFRRLLPPERQEVGRLGGRR